MNHDEKAPLITAGAKKALLKSLVAILVPGPGREIYLLVDDLQRSRTSLEEKIDKASDSLHETSRLIGELEGSLKERADKLSTLKNEIERYSALAEIEEPKARALLAQLDITLNKGKNRERVISFAINILAGFILFVLGVLLSPYIQHAFGIGNR